MEFKNFEKKHSVNYKGWELHQRDQLSQESVLSEDKNPIRSGVPSIKFFEFIISFVFFALFFGLPLFFLNETFQGVVFEKQMYFYFWVLVATISWLTKSIIAGELKIRETPLDYFIWAFVFVYFLSNPCVK
ncbi:MAG: hypothetical protein HGA61_01705 [Candidatus Moranbacteria bacterium]|nr:hypothetical protein [Candidatus Moranbacteria bacterium]